jgi:hypothetical protein
MQSRMAEKSIATLTALAAAAGVIAAGGAGSSGKSSAIPAHVASPARTAGGTPAN